MAVAGYVAGGRAALAAIAAAGYDVLRGTPRAAQAAAGRPSCSSPTRGGGEPMTALAVDDTDVRAAYRHCEQVTRTQARNFSYGIRLLPAPKRRALSAVYAFARRIDDIGDGTLPAGEKLAALARSAGRGRRH